MTASETPSSDEILRSIEAQTEDLCHIHDHITRIITNLDIGAEWFSGYDDPGRAKFDLEPMVRLFLYKHARDLNQSELARRLQGAAYVHLRLGFDRPISQQIISHNKRERFDPDERRLLKDAAEVIRSVYSDHDIIRTNEPALDLKRFSTTRSVTRRSWTRWSVRLNLGSVNSPQIVPVTRSTRWKRISSDKGT
ncbi:hypothetical protein [Halalkalirubrum salinum]|uniref:hypothetical protein n=1 Tax=Halalkalirubrum salinum TaxID=2563889 RepID=UPI00197AE8CB|nr:hypothetical protein [Halalkalirubrum salinum]